MLTQKGAQPTYFCKPHIICEKTPPPPKKNGIPDLWFGHPCDTKFPNHKPPIQIVDGQQAKCLCDL